jgi:hypothetical protein
MRQRRGVERSGEWEMRASEEGVGCQAPLYRGRGGGLAASSLIELVGR